MGVVTAAGLESVVAGGRLIALIVRAALRPEATTFVTDPSLPQQVGFVVYPEGGEVPRHVHRPIRRVLDGTAEVVLVREGRCEVDLYDDERELVETRELGPGDLVVLVGGGHGFRMLEDTTLLEVKQGPYTSIDEKETF